MSIRSDGERRDDQVRVVAEVVLKEHRNVVNFFSLSSTLIVRCPNVEACEMVMVGIFAIVAAGGIDSAYLTSTNAAQNCSVIFCFPFYDKAV